MVSVLRPGQPHINIPGIGVTTSRRAVASGAAAWYLTGGIPLANCKAAYAPKGATSAEAAKINLPTPGTNDATGGVNPTWDAATGWTGDGTMYLLAGTLTASSAGMSLVFRYSNWVANGDYRCGSGGLYIAPLWFSATDNMHYAGSLVSYSAGTAAGVVAIAGQKAYFNGTLKGSFSGSVINTPFGILARGDGSTRCRGSISHYAIYDIDISANIAVLSAAMAAL